MVMMLSEVLAFRMIEPNYVRYLKKTTNEERRKIKEALERARQKQIKAMKGGRR